MPFDPTDPDTIAAVELAVTEATTGLDKKNKELLDEVKTLRRNGADPKQIEKLETQIETLQTERDTLAKDVRTITARATKAEKALETESTDNRTLRVEHGLTAALAAAKVSDALMPGAIALLKPQVEVKEVDGKRVAMLGDKPVSEAVTLWAASDVGKHYVAAPSNGGGGAHGGAEGGSGKQINRTAFQALTPQERVDFSKGGGNVID